MKKTLFLVAAMLTIGIANAQIAIGRIGTGNINIAGTEWSEVYGIDFDNDGVLEFRISDFSSANATWTGAYLSYNWTEGGNNVYADPAAWDYAAVLAEGDVIDAYGAFNGYGDAAFADLTTVPEHIFVGFRILLADGVHYGWAEATVVASAASADIELRWTRCAYNTTPGAAIAAGQSSTTAIADNLPDGVSVSAIGHNTLRIEAPDNLVTLMGIDGREVATLHVAGHATLQAPSAGVYLLRIGTRTTKVLVR